MSYISQGAMALPPTLFSHTLRFCYAFVVINWQKHSFRNAASNREHRVYNLLSESVRNDRKEARIIGL